MKMKTYQIKVIGFIVFLGLGIASYGSKPIRANDSMSFAQPAPIFVFDLNGVFFDTNKFKVFRQLGMKDVLYYLFRHRSPEQIKLKFYTTLNQIDRSDNTSLSIKDTEGIKMPSLMVHWLRGTKSNQEILDQILPAIAANPQWFSNTTEQRLMAAMARAIFDPQQFTASRTFLPDLLPIVRYLKKRGATLYILSNWDKESFALIKEQYKDFFALFDGIFISGEQEMAKPELPLFAHITHRTAHNGICFFDDQQDNLDASKIIGWYPILVSKKSTTFGSSIDMESIKQQLRTFLKNYQLNNAIFQEQPDAP